MVHGPLIYQYPPKKETTAVYLTEDDQTIKDAETSTNKKAAEENNKFTHVRLVLFLPVQHFTLACCNLAVANLLQPRKYWADF